MNLDPSILLAAGIPLLGLAATWGSLSTRIRYLEREAGKIDPLVKLVEGLNTKLEDVRNNQGKRIGDVEAAVAVLKGKFEGFEMGRRTRTAAHGIPTTKGGG